MPSRTTPAQRLVRRLLGLAYELTPQVLAVAAFVAGAVMLASAMTPEYDARLRQLTGVVSPILIDLSHFVASIAGFLLMLLSAGLKEERRELLWAFAGMADSYGGAAVFYSVSEAVLGDLATMGLAVRKVGETAVIEVADFSMEGKSKQNLRTAVNRAEREGGSFEVLPPGSVGPIVDELRAVSDAWLKMHEGTEKAFSLGRFDPAYLDLTPLAVVRSEGRIVAFANLLTAPDEAAVDLMRYAPDAPHGVMDYLFTRCTQWAKDQGMARFDLGMAPLSGLEDRRMAPVFARVGALVYDEGGALYGFQGLRSYKAKFAPDWRSRFIAAPASTPLPLALLDVALLTSGGWLGMLGLKK